jgi:AcrR family transcriptional regulator
MPPDKRPTLQDRKRRLAREHIEAAALKLFSERGYDETTIDDIAEAAGISARTFFRYFPSKEDVVFADHEDELRRFAEALRAQPARAALLTRVQNALKATQLIEPSPALQVRQQLSATIPSVRDRTWRLHLDYRQVVADYVFGRRSDLRRRVSGSEHGHHGRAATGSKRLCRTAPRAHQRSSEARTAMSATATIAATAPAEGLLEYHACRGVDRPWRVQGALPTPQNERPSGAQERWRNQARRDCQC